MARLTPAEKAIRTAHIRKLMKAAIILDLFIHDRVRSAEQNSTALKFEIDITLRKTKASSIYEWYIDNSTQDGPYNEYDYNTRRYVEKIGPHRVRLNNIVLQPTIAHIRKTDPSSDMGIYKPEDLRVVQKGYTKEDFSWAKSVLTNEGIDLTKINIDGYPVTLRYKKTFVMSHSEVVYVKSEAEAIELQQAVLRGETNKTFQNHNFTFTESKVYTGTDLEGDGMNISNLPAISQV
jgi:hypothetical protein